MQQIPSPAELAEAKRTLVPENGRAAVAAHLENLSTQVALLVDGTVDDAEDVLEYAEVLHGALQTRLSQAQA